MSSDLWDDFRGKPEHTQLQSSQSPWGPQQEYLRHLFTQGQHQFGKGPYSYDPSSNTALAERMTAQRALDPNSLVGQSQRQLGDTISGKYLDPKTNPYLEGSVNDALGLAKSQFLGLYGGPAGVNIGNSGFQEQLTRTLANTALPAYQNAYSQERQNQLNAMNLAPTLDYANLTALGGVGAQQDERSRAQFNSPWENLSRFQSAITGNYGGVTDQQVPWMSQIYKNYQSERDANMNMASSAMQMFSDVRLKENIERIGTHDTGIGIYKYNYKGDETPQIGVLAQEVEQVMPEAVGEVAGFKTVNFKMI